MKLLLLPYRFDRYRVVTRGGVAVYATPSHSSPVIYHFAQDDELSVDRKTDGNGMVWVHHAHGLGADNDLAASAQDGQGWIPILSESGQIQMQQLERRKPVRLIQAAGERSFAFTGDKKPLRRHLSQI